jgi:hypothetical protein
MFPVEVLVVSFSHQRAAIILVATVMKASTGKACCIHNTTVLHADIQGGCLAHGRRIDFLIFPRTNPALLSSECPLHFHFFLGYEDIDTEVLLGLTLFRCTTSGCGARTFTNRISWPFAVTGCT